MSKPKKRIVAEQFVAGSFVLVDKTGHPRGGMMVGPDGMASLAFFDKAGEIMASLSVEEDGTSKLVVNDMIVRFEKDLGALGK